jgi:hypothetical protein
MLRITFQEAAEGATIKAEGKLAGPWVGEMERSWTGCGPGTQVKVDLSGVTYIDGEGKKLLARMLGGGVSLEGTQLMTRYILDEIRRTETFSERDGG